MVTHIFKKIFKGGGSRKLWTFPTFLNGQIFVKLDKRLWKTFAMFSNLSVNSVMAQAAALHLAALLLQYELEKNGGQKFDFFLVI